MLESKNNKVVFKVGGEKQYAFPVRILQPQDVHCKLSENKKEIELQYGKDFEVLPQSNYDNGCMVKFNRTLPYGETLVIYRENELTQELALPNHGKLPSEGLETALDKITMICQQFKEELARCVKVAATEGQKPEDVIAMLLGAKDMALTAAETSTNAAASASAANLSMQTIWAEITGNDASAQEALEALKQAFEAAGSVEAAAAAGRESVNAASLAAVQYAQGQIEESKDASLAVLSATTKDRKAELLALISETIGAEGAVAAAVKAAEAAAINAKESAYSIDAATQEALASVNAAVGVADEKRQEAQAAATEAKEQAEQAGDAAANAYTYIADTLANRNASAQSAQSAAQSAASAQIAADAAAGAAGEAATTAAAQSITAHNNNVAAHSDLFNSKAPKIHGHTVSDVTGLQGALDDKAPTSELAKYFRKSGGEVTGSISLGGSIARPDDTGLLSLYGGTGSSTGAYLNLFGQSYVGNDGYAGGFQIVVGKEGTNHVLQAFPDGRIKWKSMEIERVNVPGSNYIRFESGLQICWGVTPKGASVTVTFPKAFLSAAYGLSTCRAYVAGAGNYEQTIISKTATGFTLEALLTNSYWIAVGYWK